MSRRNEQARKAAVDEIWKKAQEYGLIPDKSFMEDKKNTAFLILAGQILRNRTPAYMLEKQLGQGSYGEVWKARDMHTGAAVLVKILQAGSIEGKKRAKLEERLRVLSGHPNILGLRDLMVDESNGGAVWLVVDFVEQTESLELYLAQKFREGIWIPTKEIEKIVMQCLEALEFAHSKGIVHGDLTPSSIFMQKTGKVLLGDFGLFTVLSEARSRGRYPIAKEKLVLTAEYAAPEVLLGDTPDPRSDLFSLGVIAYMLLTKRHPFIDPSGLTSTAERIQRMDFVPQRPSAINRRIPKRMDKTVMRLLEKNRHKRLASAAEACKEWCGRKSKTLQN